MNVPPVILSIAGHDPSSGAGATADIKTAAAFGCYAVTCLTALTVQTTQGVAAVEMIKPSLVSATLQSLADDFPIAAIRIGMTGLGEIVDVIADFLQKRRFHNIILDPVIRSSSGARLLDDAGVEVLRRRLLPLCDVVTPNLDEAATLAETPPTSVESRWEEILPRLRIMAWTLHDMGSRAVVITGGHLEEPYDFLSYHEAGQRKEEVFPGQHIESRSTHGTGCAFATAIACGLAQGRHLPAAIREAKGFVRSAIEAAYPLGHGTGPVNHLYRTMSPTKPAST